MTLPLASTHSLGDSCTFATRHTNTHTHLHSPAVTFEGQGPGGRTGFERLDEVEGLAG